MDRPKSPLGEMIPQLRRPGTQPRFLLLGAIGTGKSTEMQRLGDMPGHRFTVFLDVARHFRRTFGSDVAVERLQPWEVLMLAGLALCKAGMDAGYLQASHQSQLKKAIEGLLPAKEGGEKPSVDVSGMMKVLAVMVAGATKGGLLGSALGPAGTVVGTVGGALAGAELGAAGWRVLDAVTGAFQWKIVLGREGAERVDDEEPARKPCCTRWTRWWGRSRAPAAAWSWSSTGPTASRSGLRPSASSWPPGSSGASTAGW